MNEEELNDNELVNNWCIVAILDAIERLGLEGCLESIESINNPVLRWKLRFIFGKILFKQ